MRWLLLAMLLVTGSAKALSDTDCLAYTLHKEASGESLRGKRAVLDVLYNRMRIRVKSACQVIKEKGQFSWYKPGMKFKLTINMLTDFFTADNMPSILPSDCEYFHNKGVKPAWARRFKKVATIGQHSFYSNDKRNRF